MANNFEEGQGSQKDVVPVMMMMMSHILKHVVLQGLLTDKYM
jgi:hypothetical protein